VEDRGNFLLDPPFARHPPAWVSVNARTLGLFIAILATMGILFDLLYLLASSTIIAGIPFLATMSLVTDMVGAALGLIGAGRMFQGEVQGKIQVIYGLAVGFVAEILVGITLHSPGRTLGAWAVFVCLYYLVVVSRYPSPSQGSGPPPR